MGEPVEVTAQDLLDRVAARRQRSGSKRNGGTSADEDTPGLAWPTEQRTCDQGHSYTVVKWGGSWRPERCVICHPPAQAARGAVQVASGLSGRALYEAMAEAGVNVFAYRDATMAAWDASDDPHALVAARSWLDEWYESKGEWPARRSWCYFYGAGSAHDGGVVIGRLGNGKTMLAVAMVRELLEAGALNPSSFRFVTMERLLLEAEATFRSQSEDSELRMLRRYERLDLLIVDEVGVRDAPSNHATRIVDELTKARQGKATIWTSNLSIKVLIRTGVGMERIASRIAGECGEGAKYVVEFSGRDRRRERSLKGRRVADG